MNMEAELGSMLHVKDKALDLQGVGPPFCPPSSPSYVAKKIKCA